MADSVEQIEAQPEVRQALDRASGTKPATRTEAKDKFWFVTYLFLLAVCAALYLLARASFVPLPAPQLSLLQRVVRGAALIILVLALAKAVSVYAIGKVTEAATRFTLRRIERLLVTLLVTLIAISVVFVNWYTALISLGVVSVIVGLSVQTPMTSFIGWIYLLVRQPYRVGDRIQIGDATGDVIDISYFDTTLWEFGGKYLSSDHPSGRIIKFPNSKVLDSVVFNYSWPLFPYIWNEIRFQIAYQSDLKFVADTMQRIVEEELGEHMLERVQLYREILAKTPVDELEVRAHPRVIFRADDVTWLNAIVRYLAAPREAGSIKTRLIRKLLDGLNVAPEKVMFPTGAAR